MCSVVAKAVCRSVTLSAVCSMTGYDALTTDNLLVQSHRMAQKNGHPDPAHKMLPTTTRAAMAAAANEGHHNDHDNGTPVDVIKAALEAAVEHVSDSSGQMEQPIQPETSSLDVITNPGARMWWKQWLGERSTAMRKVVTNAFVLWYVVNAFHAFE
eukprot:SAG31_NODE_1155_length_9624_cov_3.380157_9_plen_156_part_00